MRTKPTSIKVYPETWKQVKIRCIIKGILIQDFVDAALKEALKH